MRRGDIWTIEPVDHPKAPAVIVSVNPWNDHALYVILVPLTAKPGPCRPHVSHSTLKAASYAICGAISAIPKGRLKKKTGRVKPEQMAVMEREPRRLMGL